jgi:V/A-type H+-transporting ATPase subunit B
MKDGIGAGYTREDHKPLTDQLFSSYSHVQEARSLASVIGEDELSDTDKLYIRFGETFENHFVNQGPEVNRSIDYTLNLGWALLSLLPREELDRVDSEVLDKFYNAKDAKERFNIKEKSLVRELGQKGE